DLNGLLGDKIVLLACLAVFFYRPLEDTLNRWGRTYQAGLGYPERSAAVLWSAYWLIFLGAQVATAFALCEWQDVLTDNEPWLIFPLALLAAVTLGNLVGMFTPSGAGLGILLLGFCLGPILPTVLGVALRAFPGREGTTAGALLAV